jgi:uncharacterized protein (TIGR03000 family)
MFRRHWRFVLVVTVVAATLSMGVSQAEATWHGYYRSACVSGCAPSCAASCCSSYTAYSGRYSGYSGRYSGYSGRYSGYSGRYSGCFGRHCGSYARYWGPGPIRRLFGHYRPYYVGYGYSHYSGCSCGTCYGGTSTSGCCSGTTDQATYGSEAGPSPTPAELPEVAPPDAPDPIPDDDTVPMEPPISSATELQDAGLLTVFVPKDAKVIINGAATSSVGSQRQYLSRGLKPEFSYSYEIRVRVVRDGQLREDVRTVTLTAGRSTALVFNLKAPASTLAASW